MFKDKAQSKLFVSYRRPRFAHVEPSGACAHRRFMRWPLILALASCVVVVAQPNGNADECFCLTNTTGAVLRGCKAYKTPMDDYPTAVCIDPASRKKSEQTLYPDTRWQRIEAGADRCDPCWPAVSGARELPRGGDNGQSEAEKQ